MKKLIIVIAIITFVLILISAMRFLIIENPAVINNIALGQMDNSNESYLIMESHNRVKNTFLAIYSWIFGFTI